jgi:hypothetical protein
MHDVYSISASLLEGVIVAAILWWLNFCIYQISTYKSYESADLLV